MQQRPVTIVGAGISGLVLGRKLGLRGIPVVLYDRNQSASRHKYSISLSSRTINSLLDLLNIDAEAFGLKVGINHPAKPNWEHDSASGLRVNRAKLEALLRDGLAIKFEHKLSEVEVLSESLLLSFQNGAQVRSSFTVGADGPLSRMRASLIPEFKPSVLPYVVINGKRSLSREKSLEMIRHFGGADKIEQKIDHTVLQAYINDIEDERMSISYTFSRPALSDNDILYRPTRSAAEATEIPQEFYEELNWLNLNDAFRIVFDPSEVGEGRTLHWLMRSGLIRKNDPLRLADSNVVFVGEVSHPLPILGSIGANTAILEALDLADHIVAGLSIPDFYKRRFHELEAETQQGKQTLHDMHALERNLNATL